MTKCKEEYTEFKHKTEIKNQNRIATSHVSLENESFLEND